MLLDVFLIRRDLGWFLGSAHLSFALQSSSRYAVKDFMAGQALKSSDIGKVIVLDIQHALRDEKWHYKDNQDRSLPRTSVRVYLSVWTRLIKRIYSGFFQCVPDSVRNKVMANFPDKQIKTQIYSFTVV